VAKFPSEKEVAYYVDRVIGQLYPMLLPVAAEFALVIGKSKIFEYSVENCLNLPLVESMILEIYGNSDALNIIASILFSQTVFWKYYFPRTAVYYRLANALFKKSSDAVLLFRKHGCLQNVYQQAMKDLTGNYSGVIGSSVSSDFELLANFNREFYAGFNGKDTFFSRPMKSLTEFWRESEDLVPVVLNLVMQANASRTLIVNALEFVESVAQCDPQTGIEFIKNESEDFYSRVNRDACLRLVKLSISVLSTMGPAGVNFAIRDLKRMIQFQVFKVDVFLLFCTFLTGKQCDKEEMSQILDSFFMKCDDLRVFGCHEFASLYGEKTRKRWMERCHELISKQIGSLQCELTGEEAGVILEKLNIAKAFLVHCYGAKFGRNVILLDEKVKCVLRSLKENSSNDGRIKELGTVIRGLRVKSRQ
jgi:hypothetical protein